jgi:2-desacetyl-2-hydroxyethyl bacteriochlorophyllide A dehydrogenase
MREALLERPGRLVLVERDEPSLTSPSDVLVAVRRVGICGTDLHAYTGQQNFFAYPRVLGHELAVEVLEVGADVDRVRVGDHCAVLPYLSCGSCAGCSRGRSNCCERIDVMGVTIDGGMCERMVVPAAHLFPDPTLSLDELVLVETLGIGWHAVARTNPAATDSVLILGAGPIGLGIAQAAALRTDRILIADIAPERVAFAAAAGLSALLVTDDLAALVIDAGEGSLPTTVFDATGSRASMQSAVGLAGYGGSVVFVGHTTGDITIHNPTFHRRELDLRASRNATFADWDGVMAAVRAGSLAAMSWINHRSSLEGIVDELPRIAEAPGAIVKSVVEVTQGGRA